MMGFFDKVKKTFGSKKEEVESHNIVNDDVIGKPAPADDIRNFKYLDNLIHSESKEIVLDSDIVLGYGEEFEYGEGIKLIADDLIIDGNGHSIDACGRVRIFYCAGRNVTIKNITLKNGFTEMRGGAIFNDNRGTLTIVESKLSGNASKNNGGAIYNRGTLVISKSALTENTTNDEGGAISNRGELTISESEFAKNAASRMGGAISNTGELSVVSSKLTSNQARLGGGVICNGGIEFFIADSTLSENISECIDGGVIFNEEGGFRISECRISNNKSLGNIVCNVDSLQIFNTDFEANESEHVISNEGGLSSLSLYYCRFSDNASSEGVVFNDGKGCAVEGSVFERNTSDNIINRADLILMGPKIRDEGQTILNENGGYVLVRDESHDFLNRIYGPGEVECLQDRIPDEEMFDFGYLDAMIHEATSREIVMDEDISLEDYEADYYEGGIELDIDGLVIDGKGHTIDGSDKSRIFLITGHNVKLKNIIFKNGLSHNSYDNLENSSGGVIKINHASGVTIENCEFKENASERNGGVIHIRGCDLTILESTLMQNSANFMGGAIYNDNGSVTIADCTLLENNAWGPWWGGGAVYNSEGKLSISKSKMMKNRVDRYGGAIFNDNGILDICESVISQNASNHVAGAINNSGEVTITESVLEENSAPWGAGAIRNDGGNIVIRKSELSKNVAQDEYSVGGAILHDGGELTVMDSMLLENASGNSGGAVKSNGGELTVQNCIFTDNKPDDVYE